MQHRWLAFLKKETHAQSPGAIVRCELYQEGSNPDESPRMRVRRWRDNDVATTQHAKRGSYTRVVQTTFELK